MTKPKTIKSDTKDQSSRNNRKPLATTTNTPANGAGRLTQIQSRGTSQHASHLNEILISMQQTPNSGNFRTHARASTSLAPSTV